MNNITNRLKITLADTRKDMCSTDYKKRFKAELQQLIIRIVKLKVIIDTYDKLAFKPLSSKKILIYQYDAMCSYLRTLEIRAEMENIDIDAILKESFDYD